MDANLSIAARWPRAGRKGRRWPGEEDRRVLMAPRPYRGPCNCSGHVATWAWRWKIFRGVRAAATGASGSQNGARRDSL